MLKGPTPVSSLHYTPTPSVIPNVANGPQTFKSYHMQQMINKGLVILSLLIFHEVGLHKRKKSAFKSAFQSEIFLPVLTLGSSW